jgi:threonine aldolase
MKEMVKDFDLVNVCLSKGMGCPMGSMIAGSAKEIARAKVYRKMLGGAMRQTGIISACALVSLMDWQEKLSVDNANAKFLAEELAAIPGV